MLFDTSHYLHKELNSTDCDGIKQYIIDTTAASETRPLVKGLSGALILLEEVPHRQQTSTHCSCCHE